MTTRITRSILALALLATTVTAVEGADLRIGALTDPSVDPHYLYLSTNIAYSRHLFDALVDKDDNAQWLPGLATSWRAIDSLTWEFKLRPGVKFHDGSDFTAEDVAFSMKRVPSIPNNPNAYTTNIRMIAGIEVVDPLTIRFKTKETSPALPGTVGNIFIVSHKAAANATPADFRSGKATVGTGPYKFVEFVPGERLVLARNDAYWGKKPVWDKVTFRIIPNGSARVAALLAGDVDVVDFVPPNDVETLRKNAKVRVFQRPSDRIIYLNPDVRETTAYVTDKAGKPLGKNPLRDLRVRQALSKAVNREALVERAMDGLAIATGQLVPKGFVGYNPDIKVEKYDPEGAKKLLAEAGYPDGFGMTIHGPNDRYVNDAKVTQTVAQMFARIGLAMKVVTQTKTIFFGKALQPNAEYSFLLLGWGSSGTGESTHSMPGLFHTFDKAKGFGFVNPGGYSNKQLDELIEQAIVILDKDKRDKVLQHVMQVAMKDLPVIPLYNQFTVVATRAGIAFSPRADEQTVATSARPAP